MIVKLIYLLFLKIVYAYNIDVDFPIIYFGKDALENDHSYFGYTVYLHRESDSTARWLIVGAPRANYSELSKNKSYPIEPGVAYRCEIEHGDRCREIKPEVIEDENDYVKRFDMKTLVKKQRGWFGSTIAIDESNKRLTICAPRTIITFFTVLNSPYFESMHGMCYSGNVSSNSLSIEDKNLKFHDFSLTFWYNPMHGFTVHYSSLRHNEEKKRKNAFSRIVGQPKYDNYGSVDLQHLNGRRTLELPLSDELTQFGYSVESGYFFKRDQLLYVSGAPGWQYVGQVGVVNPAINGFVEAKLQGTEIGEFYGASLAVGDLNNDGLDDLLVGAPYWGEDNGKVYAYFGTSKGQFEVATVLEGPVEGGYFGYAIASGDLDVDGFDDIIVGAPWEEDGVIYIYNGGPDLKDRNLRASERIFVADISRLGLRKVQRFGFSISKPVDIDYNGYADIAVGAYKSGHAIVLRGKPVVKTELAIKTVPDVLQRDAKQFLINVCAKYIGYNVPGFQDFQISITVDERYQRTEETTLELKSSTKFECLSASINISKNVQDFIEPISIVAKHDFLYKNGSTFCKSCPVERKDNKLRVAQALLSFNIGCGDDGVCNSNISAVAIFHNVRGNDVWVIGSDDISLEVNLKNHGEPAYLTMMKFVLPMGVVLRSILTSCQEDIFHGQLMVICEAGNPIWKGEERTVQLDLDMKHLINGSTNNNNYELNFDIKIETRSKNHGETDLIKTLKLINEVSLSLHGKAKEEAYYLITSNDIAPNISFQHTYQVYKLGASSIQDARLIVRIPTAMRHSETLVYLYKPQFYVSGKRFECFTENSLLNTDQIEEEEEEDSSEPFDIFPFSDKLQQRDTRQLDEQNLNESTRKLGGIENIQVSNESSTNNIIYMNCSTSRMNCTIVECDLSGLKTLQDIGKLTIQLSLDVEKLKESFRDDRIILRYSSEANVRIIQPAVRLDANETCSVMEVATTFYNAPKPEELQLWIVLVSVLVGLLLLLILIVILSRLGFFKRKGKQDLAELKNVEKPNTETSTVTESGNS